MVFTMDHDLQTALSGVPHPCDVTNLGKNPLPGPTCTASLDTAAKEFGFT